MQKVSSFSAKDTGRLVDEKGKRVVHFKKLSLINIEGKDRGPIREYQYLLWGQRSD